MRKGATKIFSDGFDLDAELAEAALAEAAARAEASLRKENHDTNVHLEPVQAQSATSLPVTGRKDEKPETALPIEKTSPDAAPEALQAETPQK